VSYKVLVTTGDRKGAGTDGNVHIVLYGTACEKHLLDGPGNLFERNQTDTFGFTTVDLGDLQKIRIGHDNSGFGAAWFLDKVVVSNEKTQQQWFFYVESGLPKMKTMVQLSGRLLLPLRMGQ